MGRGNIKTYKKIFPIHWDNFVAIIISYLIIFGSIHQWWMVEVIKLLSNTPCLLEKHIIYVKLKCLCQTINYHSWQHMILLYSKIPFHGIWYSFCGTRTTLHHQSWFCHHVPSEMIADLGTFIPSHHNWTLRLSGTHFMTSNCGCGFTKQLAPFCARKH